MNSGLEVAAVEDISISYGRRPAVEKVSFVLAEGEYVSLVGRNGSGKSTLMKGILGLLPLTSGRIHIEGGKNAIAFLPQEQTVAPDFPATVWEVALSGCQPGDRTFLFHGRHNFRLAEESLAAMGVADLAGRRIGSLSGGQRQRAFLARCLCRRPRLLLLDEPFASLDPEATDSLSQLLCDLQTERGLTILMSSHDLDNVEARASRVLVIERKLLFDGDVGEWLNSFRKERGAPCSRC